MYECIWIYIYIYTYNDMHTHKYICIQMPHKCPVCLYYYVCRCSMYFTILYIIHDIAACVYHDTTYIYLTSVSINFLFFFHREHSQMMMGTQEDTHHVSRSGFDLQFLGYHLNEVHTHTHTYIHTHTHTHTHIPTQVQIRTGTHTRSLSRSLSLSRSFYLYLSLSLAHTHTDTQIHTHTHINTDGVRRVHTHTQIYTHARTHTYTYTHKRTLLKVGFPHLKKCAEYERHTHTTLTIFSSLAVSLFHKHTNKLGRGSLSHTRTHTYLHTHK